MFSGPINTLNLCAPTWRIYTHTHTHMHMHTHTHTHAHAHTHTHTRVRRGIQRGRAAVHYARKNKTVRLRSAHQVVRSPLPFHTEHRQPNVYVSVCVCDRTCRPLASAALWLLYRQNDRQAKPSSMYYRPIEWTFNDATIITSLLIVTPRKEN